MSASSGKKKKRNLPVGAKIDQVNGRYHAYLDHHFIGMFPTQDKAEKAIEKMHKKNKQIDTNFKNWLFK